MQLGQRARETDERIIAGILFIVSTCIRSRSELVLAMILARWGAEQSSEEDDQL